MNLWHKVLIIIIVTKFTIILVNIFLHNPKNSRGFVYHTEHPQLQNGSIHTAHVSVGMGLNVEDKLDEEKIYYGTNATIAKHFNNKEMFIKYRHKFDGSRIKRFPRLICIGTAKSGTQALLEFLNLHPQIKSVPTEDLFFIFAVDGGINFRGLERYLKRKPYTHKYELTFEKTPQLSLAHPDVDRRVPQLIKDYDQSIKLLFAVRNPINRVMSMYLHDRNAHSKANRSFESFAMGTNGELNINYPPIMNSLYFTILSVWFDYFSKDQIHVVDGENLKINPSQELAKIEEFLNLTHSLTEDLFYFNEEKGFYCYHKKDRKTSQCLSKTKGHKNYPPIRPDTKAKLQRFFAPHNKKFYKLVGKNFKWE